jgi:hypothetical protein
VGAIAAAITRAVRPYRWRAYLVGGIAGIVAGGVVAPLVTTTAVLGVVLCGAPGIAQGAWDELVWSVVFALTFAAAGATAVAYWLARDLRAATKAYVWLADRSEADWRVRFGKRPVPRTAAQLRAFASATDPTPETAIQVYAAWLALAEFERARAVAHVMPDVTPADRFSRAAAIWLVEFVPGPTPAIEPLETLAAEITDPATRTEAEVELALARSRAQVAAHGDWRTPLAAARQLLRDEPTRPYRRVMWWPAFRGMLAAGLVGAAVFWVTLATDFRLF